MYYRIASLLVREDLEAAIAKVCKKHGIVPSKLGTVRYANDHFSVSNLLFNVERNENPNDIIGNRYRMGNRIFTITGIDPCGLAYTGVTQRGARYRLKIDQIKRMTKV